MGNNAVIQGTNADITKEALIRLQEAYDNIEGAKLLFTVHDEIVSEVPADRAEEIAEIKAEIMKQAFHRFVKTVPVGPDGKVSVNISSHWAK
jgi:DNA polymerase I-like protein with 3'-5' exonuclease and polymerase domains